MIDDAAALGSQLNHHHSSIVGILLTANQAGFSKRIETCRHAAAGEHHTFQQLSRRQASLLSIAAEGGEDVELTQRQTVFFENTFHTPLEVLSQHNHTANHFQRRRIQVGSGGAPLPKQPVHHIAFFAEARSLGRSCGVSRVHV